MSDEAAGGDGFPRFGVALMPRIPMDFVRLRTVASTVMRLGRVTHKSGWRAARSMSGFPHSDYVADMPDRSESGTRTNSRTAANSISIRSPRQRVRVVLGGP